MDNKIVALVITITLLALVAIAEAQPTKIYQIGYLDVTSLTAAAPLLETLRQRLRELGWVEGKNIAFEYRYGEGNPDRYPTSQSNWFDVKSM